MFLLFGAFVAGMLTVLAPCVLPLLPIIIGGSVSGDTKDRKRPLIITVSLAISLFVFTLLLKATTLLINIPPKSITYLSGSIIILLGIATLFPAIYVRLINRAGIEQASQKALGKGFRNKSLLGPIITGAALGPVFSSCSPVYAYILATVLPANFAQAMVYVVFYIAGLSLFLLLIGYYGQRFISRIKFASNPKGWFQRIIAILFIVVGVLIFTGYDKRFQTFVSEHTPFNFDAISAQFLPESKNKVDNSKVFNVQTPYEAPEFTGITQWLNGQPETIKGLRGKVVYIDFWTYSCINCIRNNPYIEQWYKTYKADGFEVIGVHAPEFSFEQVPANVQKAIVDQHISYPVALDNDYATWNAYNNDTWPAGYLIDATGKVRRIHLGEGEYKETEQAIRQLLVEKGTMVMNKSTTTTDSVPVNQDQTPETYLGLSRTANFAGSPPLSSMGTFTFTQPSSLDTNQWSLGGSWQVESDKIVAGRNATLHFHVAARDVYVVASASQPQKVGVMLDGKPISQSGSAGADVTDSTVTIGSAKLYTLVHMPKFSSASTLELTVPSGTSLNVFTFGS